ncbi:MAG: hypothetical protein CMJ83_20385 [Planctomycetes bacterium]|nr:hypothetical protein [Planctomycetota bacterium]
MSGQWCLTLVTLAASLGFLIGRPAGDDEVSPPTLQEAPLKSGYVTLWAGDETRSSFDFHQGNFGTSIVDMGEAYVNPLRDPRARAPKVAVSIIHTLAVSNRDVVFRGPPGKEHRSTQGRQILRSTPQVGMKHFNPEPGHTYLLRFKPGIGSRTDQLFAVHIIDVQPQHTLTFQWRRL